MKGTFNIKSHSTGKVAEVNESNGVCEVNVYDRYHDMDVILNFDYSTALAIHRALDTFFETEHQHPDEQRILNHEINIAIEEDSYGTVDHRL